MTTKTIDQKRDDLGSKLDRLVRCEVRMEGDDESRTLRFIASTERVARDGDIVEASAWRFEDFLKSHPSFLWAHDHQIPPIGKALSAEIVTDGDESRLEIVVEFHTDEFADRILRLYKDGFLRAVSVGFMAKSWETPSDETRAERGLGPWGVIITEADLFELSAVSVPSDVGAVVIGDRAAEVRQDLLAIRSAVPASERQSLDTLIERLGSEETHERLTRIESTLGEIVEQLKVRSSTKPVASDSAPREGTPDVSPESSDEAWSPLSDIRNALTKEGVHDASED